jgi:hypothetical protein
MMLARAAVSGRGAMTPMRHSPEMPTPKVCVNALETVFGMKGEVDRIAFPAMATIGALDLPKTGTDGVKMSATTGGVDPTGSTRGSALPPVKRFSSFRCTSGEIVVALRGVKIPRKTRGKVLATHYL